MTTETTTQQPTVASISQFIQAQGQPCLRCHPSHLCDGWSGCIRGEVIVTTPVGAMRTRMAECLRPGDREGVVFIYPNPDKPQFAHSRYVPAEWISKGDEDPRR